MAAAPHERATADLNRCRASSLMAGMFRIGLLLACLPSLAAAQAPGPDAPVVLLRDPSGKPVAEARGRVFARALGSLPALAGFAITPDDRFDFALPDQQRLDGTSDANGRLRFATEDETPPNGCAVSGMVWTASGLGALLFDLQPGRAQRVDLSPMAALSTATGTERLSVIARATAADGRTVSLPSLRGTTVRLPAGNYELWVHDEHEGWLWERRTLLSGQTVTVSFLGEGRRVKRSSAAAIVHPLDRPDVLLFRGKELETTLRGAAASALYCARLGAMVHGPAEFPPAAPDGTGAWPSAQGAPPLLWLHPVPEGETPVSQTTFVVQRLAEGSWRTLAASEVHGTRSAPQPPSQWFELPRPAPGDTWLLFVAEGCAPQACPWQGQSDRFPFELERGRPLHVLAKDEAGLPIVDLAVDYTPDGMDAAAVTGFSDARGTARLGPVLGPGTLRVVDARFANQTIHLDAIPLDGARITVAAGAALRGIAKWPDGSPARGVVVSLRDPRGELRPAQRAVATGDDGAFTFPGLREQRALVLFATTQRNGHTWSARLDRAVAGADGEIELVLRDEDPEFTAPNGR